MENSVNPDQTPRSAASDLGLHCLLRPVIPNTEKVWSINTLRNGSAPDQVRCPLTESLDIVVALAYLGFHCSHMT